MYRDIVEQLNARAAEHWTSDNYAKISASVRMHMKQYATEVQQLKNKLELSHSLYPFLLFIIYFILFLNIYVGHICLKSLVWYLIKLIYMLSIITLFFKFKLAEEGMIGY